MKKKLAVMRAGLDHKFRTFKKRARARWDTLPTLGTARIGLLALGVFILVALIYLAQSSNAALTARELRVKQLQIAEVERQNAQLRYEIAALASPSAIEQRARKMGLGPAKRVVYADMPWIQPEPNELMPAFLPQEMPLTTPQVFEPNSNPTFDDILSMFGLENFTNRVNAQTK